MKYIKVYVQSSKNKFESYLFEELTDLDNYLDSHCDIFVGVYTDLTSAVQGAKDRESYLKASSIVEGLDSQQLRSLQGIIAKRLTEIIPS